MPLSTLGCSLVEALTFHQVTHTHTHTHTLHKLAATNYRVAWIPICNYQAAWSCQKIGLIPFMSFRSLESKHLMRSYCHSLWNEHTHHASRLLRLLCNRNIRAKPQQNTECICEHCNFWNHTYIRYVLYCRCEMFFCHSSLSNTEHVLRVPIALTGMLHELLVAAKLI